MTSCAIKYPILLWQIYLWLLFTSFLLASFRTIDCSYNAELLPGTILSEAPFDTVVHLFLSLRPVVTELGPSHYYKHGFYWGFHFTKTRALIYSFTGLRNSILENYNHQNWTTTCQRKTPQGIPLIPLASRRL